MSVENRPSKTIGFCWFNFLRGLLVIRSICLASIAFVAAILFAINYLWNGEWGKYEENCENYVLFAQELT